jgi:hypothetical protein
MARTDASQSHPAGRSAHHGHPHEGISGRAASRTLQPAHARRGQTHGGLRQTRRQASVPCRRGDVGGRPSGLPSDGFQGQSGHRLHALDGRWNGKERRLDPRAKTRCPPWLPPGRQVKQAGDESRVCQSRQHFARTTGVSPRVTTVEVGRESTAETSVSAGISTSSARICSGSGPR